MAGNVAIKETAECAKVAKISLFDNSNNILQHEVTDNFGDFKLDNLPLNRDDYELVVENSDLKKHEVQFDITDKSIDLGTIFLG